MIPLGPLRFQTDLKIPQALLAANLGVQIGDKLAPTRKLLRVAISLILLDSTIEEWTWNQREELLKYGRGSYRIRS